MFGAQARFVASAVQITGSGKEYVRVGDEGTPVTFRFCPQCGSTVYYTCEADAADGWIAIPVGAFADPRFPGPTVSVYEQRMHGWVSMPGDIEHVD